ncbi:hypothetical protein BRARA_G00110 [Brassica rapa]|uniref:Uncharacterized protein n=1 Tax=Brassica campestris TaxID=3711 RepID=A0A397YNR8_BRACM|nr:hypothetical protein BRARA_G00110 [Brassica rapa]
MLRTFPCANLQLFEKEVTGMEKHQKRMKDEEFPEVSCLVTDGCHTETSSFTRCQHNHKEHAFRRVGF